MEKNRHKVTPRTFCLIFHQDEVLLLRAGDLKEWSGSLVGVGGHIEKGESILDSARKEIREETGLEVHDVKLRGIVHVSNFFNKEIMLFVVSAFSDTKEVISNQEGTLEWIKTSDLNNQDMLEDMKPLIEHVLALEPGKMFFGTSEFDGKDGLVALDLKID